MKNGFLDIQFGRSPENRTAELEGDRSRGMWFLMDAKRYIKLFCISSKLFAPFSHNFSLLLALFETVISVEYATACSGFCGQKCSPAVAGDFHRQGRGTFFMPLTF